MGNESNPKNENDKIKENDKKKISKSRQRYGKNKFANGTTPYEMVIAYQNTDCKFSVQKQFVRRCTGCGRKNVIGGAIYTGRYFTAHFYCDECLYDIEKALKHGKVNKLHYPGIMVMREEIEHCNLCNKSDNKGYRIKIYDKTRETDESCEYVCCKRCMSRSISTLSSFNYKKNIAAIVTEMCIMQRRTDSVNEQNEEICAENCIEYDEYSGKQEFISDDIRRIICNQTALK